MSLVRSIVLAAAFTAGVANAVHAAGVSVPVDNVTLVTFRQPVATIYMGNPSIADVTLVDPKHVFVLGKRFGRTNLIALSNDKTIVANEAVTVVSKVAGAITVFKGPNTYNFACSTLHCETRPVPGDPNNQPYFDNTQKAAEEHEDEGVKSATPGQQSQH